MSNALKNVSTKATPQTEKSRPDQVKNNAGGFVFEVSPKARLERFLILGTDGGTYYAGERDHTMQAVDFLKDLAVNDLRLLVDTVVDVSDQGRAHKNSPAIFALAVALTFAKAEDKAYVQAAVNKVVRTGTHLFEFSQYIDNLGGWGRAKRRAVANWYESKSADQVAFQAVKYRQRDGWTHRDVLRLSHAKPDSAVAKFILGKSDEEEAPEIIQGFRKAQEVTTGAEAVQVMKDYSNLPWEAFPTTVHKDPEFWLGLFEGGALPTGALLRNITRFAKLEMFNDMEFADAVATRLTDVEAIRKARLHPLNFLLAERTYSGSRTQDYYYGYQKNAPQWSVNSQVASALEDGFYASFGTIEPSNKSMLLALDVSGSMGWGGGVPSLAGMTPREIAAVMSMVTARTERKHLFKAFTSSLTDIPIKANDSLDAVINKTSGMNFGSTDCALPMLWAATQEVKVDTFVVYTDNETWAGNIKPHEALVKYRNKMGIDAKLIVVGITATKFSIADPKDPGMLDVVGFDTSAPTVIANFSRG